MFLIRYKLREITKQLTKIHKITFYTCFLYLRFALKIFGKETYLTYFQRCNNYQKAKLVYFLK